MNKRQNNQLRMFDGDFGSICATDFGVICASDFGSNCAIL
jgi:hypothetical protein